MTTAETLVRTLKKELRPSLKEKKRAQQRFVSLKKVIPKKEAEVVLGGSVAKGTQLKGPCDIDVFVRFFDATNCSDRLETFLKRSFNGVKRLHGSRDYFQVGPVEVIPVKYVNTEQEKENITDLSPLHTSFVNKNLTVSQKDDVRVAKKFFKAQKLYGAESYLLGFSGYVTELLIAHYGSFLALLKAASAWERKTSIEFSKTKAAHQFQEPLVIVDPVQEDRNAAAAVSLEKKLLFSAKAKEFLAKPSKAFFVVKRMKPEGVILRVSPLAEKKDVAGAKLLQVYKKICGELREFHVVKSDWNFSQMYFLCEQKKLSSEEIIRGPPQFSAVHASAFRKKHANVFEKEGFLYAKEKRIHSTPLQKITFVLKTTYVTDRVRSIQVKP
ncbi:MAG: nucleotidyltransferase domain-containing protein [Candidatus Woesearchaeota archaeon]|nr:MAG: nucleotidyltransferase domain-containing protein [Candidatus Woesearchaeota archaeon]